MNSHEVEAFLAIVQKESFTEAAKSLFISQSTLSNRLVNLEDELGLLLIERSKGCKGIYLTEAGKQFLISAKGWQSFMEEINRIKDTAKGKITLSIGAVDTFNAFVLPDFYNAILDNTPSISLNIRTFNSEELYQQMDMGKLDLAFTLVDLPYRNIKSKEIYREPRVVLVKDTPLTYNNGTVDVSFLEKKKEIFFIGDQAYNHWYRTVIRQDYPNIQADTVQLLHTFMKRDGSWAIVPLCVARAFINNKNYSLYKMNIPSPERICYVIEPKQKSISTSKGLQQIKEYLDAFTYMLSNREQCG